MMSKRSIGRILSGLLAALPAGAAAQPPAAGPPAPAAAERILRIQGYVNQHWQDGGRFWVQLSDPAMRFHLSGKREADVAAFAAIFDAADRRGVGLWVRFDAAAGRVSRDGARVEYPLCSVEVEGASHGADAATCPPRAPSANQGERLLALGLAYKESRTERAIALLDEALAAADLTAEARALALGARGAAGLQAAYGLRRPDPRHDRVLIEALGDYRRLTELRADDVEARFGTARALIALGGYDEALAIYREIAGRWGEAYRIAIAEGAVHRLRGDYRAALRPLDALVARDGPQQGMRFHYHRGWTLNLLGRYEEAIAAFTEGLGGQADYAYAYLRRSCAYAQLGRYREALGDQELALALLRGPTEEPFRELVAREIAQSEALAARLRRAIASGRRGPLPEACREEADDSVRARPRSPLLPAPRG